jgi:hypothetical protein
VRVNKALLRLVSVALLALAALPGVLAAQSPSRPRAERPTYTLGEKWIRSDGLFELIRIEKDSYVFSARSGWEIQLTRDLGIIRIQRGDGVFELHPPLELAWPLEVGKSGFQNSSWQTPRSSGRSFPVTIQWRVVDYEDVQVFAGSFKAFRIHATFVGQNGQASESDL